MLRKPLVMGNWKMHGSRQSVKKLMDDIRLDDETCKRVEVVVLPSFVHLQMVNDVLHRFHHSLIGLGAQDVYLHTQGAYTGEVSGPMLADVGCQYVLVGHSERRHVLQESDVLVAQKYHAALQAGLHPVLCVGETRAEREANLTETIIEQQLSAVLAEAGAEAFQQSVIAYEPVWAIGTGLSASPEEAQAVHLFIRNWLKAHQRDGGDRIRIIYGGSLKPDNAAQLFDMPDIDGGLIGGAALDGMSFSTICELILRKLQYNLH